MQAPFVTVLFKKLKELGIHTVLDTSGAGDLDQAKEVLKYTDLVLMDIKFSTQDDYIKYVKGTLTQTYDFLNLMKDMNVPFWARHVVVPDLNDTRESLEQITKIAKSYPNLEKIEFLPFRKFCLEKYEEMNLDFKLKDTPEMDEIRLKELTKDLIIL